MADDFDFYDGVTEDIEFDFYDGGAEVIFYEDPYNHDNRMIHSISFCTFLGHFDNNILDLWKNTFREWHLVPKTRPVINPPKARTEYSVIQNTDGVIDFSESLNGVHYDNRTGSWEFAVDHELNTTMSWDEIYEDILRQLHGRKVRVCLQDDPGFYYEGRVFVNEWKSDKYWSEIVLDYDLDPYKYAVHTSGDYDWLFDDAVLHKNKQLVYSRFYVDTVKYRDFYYTGSESVIPAIELRSDTKMVVQTHYNRNNQRVTLKQGKTEYPAIKLTSGHNYLTFYGTGVVSLYYNLGASL